MPVQKATAICGVGKQTAKGTIAANPTFAHGISGGGILSVDVKQDVVDVTSSKRAASNVNRDSAANGGDIKAPAYLKTLGLWLLGALGVDTVTGSSPYVHTYSTGDLPYLTIFEKGLSSTIEAVRDCKVDELTLSWDGSKPLELEVKALGTVFSYPATFVPTTDESGSESFLVPIGGTFQYDIDGATVATARITKGSLTIKNNVGSVDPSSTVEADDVTEGRQEHTLALTVVPDDLNDFRNAVTGAPAGTSIAAVAPMGSLNLVFKENNGTGQLAVTGSKVAFMCAWPEGDPKGGPVEIELSGIAVMPAAGTAPLVYALSNQQATY